MCPRHSGVSITRRTLYRSPEKRFSNVIRLFVDTIMIHLPQNKDVRSIKVSENQAIDIGGKRQKSRMGRHSDSLCAYGGGSSRKTGCSTGRTLKNHRYIFISGLIVNITMTKLKNFANTRTYQSHVNILSASLAFSHPLYRSLTRLFLRRESDG